ncbi:MAG: family 78 glycoside hydrolase catalytic domain, partial [Prevotella sp.]|nr:family 78 glycoside hydrolase catalytic domain [Prevotella sp.]
NGQKVGDSEFAPLWSDYDKTVFFNVYDVTDQLSMGVNEIRVLLGNGVYNEQGGRYHKMRISFGPPTLCFLLYVTYTDDTRERLISDDKWEWTLSPITFNSLYGGEDYDARLETDSQKREGNWQPVIVQQPPKGQLRPQLAKPVKIMERYPVKATLKRQGDSLLVLDMGQNLSGYPEITVSGQRGQRLKLIPGETLTDDGFVNQKQTGRPHYYIYTLKGSNDTLATGLPSADTEIWHPRFSYYGYRYLQIEGDIDVLKKVESCFVYNSAERIGSFECSNQLINDTHRLIDRAIRSNWQAVWTDCPHREKLGWLEQDWLNGEALVYNYDCSLMIRQTMQNIVDAQHEDGSMPEIAPEYTRFTGSWAKPFLESPEWGGAIIALPMLYWKHYGSTALVSEYYDAMKRYVDYLATQDSSFILKQGLGDWYDYGPGRAGMPKNTPMPLVATAHYYQWVCYMYVVANHLGHTLDAKQLNARAESIRQAFNREFYDSRKKIYATGSQCSMALPLYLKLVPEQDYKAVLNNLIKDIHKHGDRLTTGDIGTRYLFYVLANNGQRELLYKMLNHNDVPGYGYQIKLGHTTLTEQWDPKHGASMNHFMMGHIENLLIPDLLGITRKGELIEIMPHPVGDLTWCKGSTMSTFGPVQAEWKKEGGKFLLDIDIPTGGYAEVHMPISGREEAVGEGHHHFEEPLVVKTQKPRPKAKAQVRRKAKSKK